MLSKSQIKHIQSLQQKKYRQIYSNFLVEGEKTVNELLLSDFEIEKIYATSDYIAPTGCTTPIELVADSELAQLSSHQNPNKVIAIAKMPKAAVTGILQKKLYLVGDQINDPGNIGTMIRIAHWFGIDTIFLSEDTVDIYNPKVVSAAKGSLFNTTIQYTNLADLFTKNKHLPVFGTFMQGENIYTASLPDAAFIVMGNEANGISTALMPFIHHKINIPAFSHAESLNVGVACGIVLSEFKRRV